VRQATLRLARIELEHENGIAVIGRLHAFLEDDPFDEDMQRVLLRAYSSSGQHIAAREHLAWTREFFEQELGVSFDIDDDEIAPAPSVLSGHRAHTPAYGLPGLPGETIGREREIDSIIARLIAPGVREITVLGPGGVGKTRIAIEVAHRALPHFAGGLLWVELFTVQDRELVFAAIGRVLGLAGQAGGLERTLVLAAIRRMGRCLIVLDNLEHLPGVEQYVADLLREAPEARILATSRSPLRIRAEVQIPLGPLPLPSDNSPDSVRRNPAVQLYLRRSADWNGTVEPYSPTELAQVADLCRQLDGLPLAIELAASRSHEIEISEILAQTSSRFALLRDGPVDLPDRQRTLEATVGWSCRLLLDRADEESLEAERIALLVRDRFALPWSALMRSWIAWERGNDRRSIELGALAAERFRDAGDERNEIHALVPIVASLNRLGNSDAVVTVREIARNMIEYPSDIVLALGLTPVAETVWRLRCDERARPMLAGAELAAERAAVPRIGITTRYRNSVKERVESVDRAGAPWPRIEPLAALDLAIAAVADLG
ncbi:MAG: hypothetical protein KC438_06190, partial [Thermomicrobiales bacterium]|nr:hypothetical protein [Thermomicrobiales bacterium]